MVLRQRGAHPLAELKRRGIPMKIINTDQIVNAILNPNANEDAAVAGFRILHQNAAKFGGLGHILGRSNELLGVVAQRDAQIAALMAQVEGTQHALKSAELARKAYAAEQATKARQEVETRMIDAVAALIRDSTIPIQPERASQPQPASSNRNEGVRAKMAAKASSKARGRARSMPRGADTDNMVLSLLTNELKCVSTLFRQAQGLGFSGTENAIRFAGLRLAQARNAIEGRDYQNRIAYRRA